MKKKEKSTAEQIEIADKLIVSNEKQLRLAKELKESLLYEECTYHLIQMERVIPPRFMLVEIATKKVKSDGPISRIQSYINLRNIDKKTIYNNQAFET